MIQTAINDVLKFGRYAGKMFDAYLDCEQLRKEGKKILVCTYHPKWTENYIDSLDMVRHGRKLGNYEISDMNKPQETIQANKYKIEISEIGYDTTDPETMGSY